MSPLKVLITGGSGLLGQYINIEFSKHFEILTLYQNNIGNTNLFNNHQVDLTDFASVKSIFDDFKPDIVFHTAAISTVHDCDILHPSIVFETNVKITEHLAELCNNFNSKLFYTSTDLVYAGYRGSMLTETSKLVPVSLYAETKLMGEVKIKQICNNYVILRMSLLFGFGLNQRSCFFEHMITNLNNNQSVNLFTDQYRTPLFLQDAAIASVDLIKNGVTNEIINLGGIDRLSRFELGELVSQTGGFDKELLQPIKMENVPNFPIVSDVSLNTDKLKSFGVKIHDIDEIIFKLFNKDKR
ncbi:MAG TPA: SDR family oxidoreductase [Ignavibacteriaceae bacterium]|nr:SDR family oxidoreductase [Ignavibacteriaceae bacterium]